jgi:hypothetical protein
MLLGNQAIAFGGLPLRRHADVSGNPKWLRTYPETGSLQSLQSFRHHNKAQANWVRPR